MKVELKSVEDVGDSLSVMQYLSVLEFQDFLLAEESTTP